MPQVINCPDCELASQLFINLVGSAVILSILVLFGTAMFIMLRMIWRGLRAKWHSQR